jgi:hypothetical protein
MVACQLNGTVPNSLSSLEKLQFLYLHNNMLSGTAINPFP